MQSNSIHSSDKLAEGFVQLEHSVFVNSFSEPIEISAISNLWVVPTYISYPFTGWVYLRPILQELIIVIG